MDAPKGEGRTAFTAKDAKNAKGDNVLSAFALLGALGDLGGRCRCLILICRHRRFSS
jgi:hypothetical protein